MIAAADDEDDHGLHVHLEDLRDARFGSAPAIERIESASHRYLARAYATDLSPDDREEIVRAAMAEAWEHLVQDIELREVRAELRKALERLKKARKRRRARARMCVDIESLGRHDAAADPLTEFIELDHAKAVVAALGPFVSTALAALGDPQYDLILAYYDLPLPARRSGPVVFPSHHAAKRALTRARHRFSFTLERLIARAIARDEGDPLVLRDALDYVRGGLRKGAFASFERMFPDALL